MELDQISTTFHTPLFSGTEFCSKMKSILRQRIPDEYLICQLLPTIWRRSRAENELN